MFSLWSHLVERPSAALRICCFRLLVFSFHCLRLRSDLVHPSVLPLLLYRAMPPSALFGCFSIWRACASSPRRDPPPPPSAFKVPAAFASAEQQAPSPPRAACLLGCRVWLRSSVSSPASRLLRLPSPSGFCWCRLRATDGAPPSYPCLSPAQTRTLPFSSFCALRLGEAEIERPADFCDGENM